MELDAIRVEQNGRELYVTTMTAEQLKNEEFVRVDEYSSANNRGYQRLPADSRISAFARYISQAKGISPLSVTLSAREPVKFRSTTGNVGKLSIPEKSPLWIVDGQHRIGGLRHLLDDHAEYGNFALPVVILPTYGVNGTQDPRDAEYEEAKEFLVINRTQKGVRADLAERFLGQLVRAEGAKVIQGLPSQITRGIEWVPKATEIVDKLNESGPWRGKIRMPNDPRGTTVAAQKSFTDSLEPILASADFKAYTSDEIAEFLRRYWAAISELCPEAFERPGDYVLQKTTGLFVLHGVFPTVARMAAKSGVITKETIKEVLEREPLEEFMKSDYWSSSSGAGLMGSSLKAFGILEAKIQNALEEAADDRAPRGEKPYKLS